MRYVIVNGFLLLALMPASAFGQTVWAGLTTYGGSSYDANFGMDIMGDKIVQTLFSTSYQVSSGTGTDFIVMVNNPAGGSYWETLVGKPDTNEWAYDVAFLTDGNAVVAGVSCIPNNGDPTRCIYNGRGFIIKLNQADGSIMWSKMLTDAWGNADVWLRIFDVEATSDGGFVVGGEIEYSSYDRDAFVAKFGSDGALQWSRIYGTSRNQWINSVFETADGNIVAIAPVFDEVWIGKMDATNGSLLWQRSYGRNTNGGRVFFAWAYPTSDGGFILAHEIEGSNGDKDILFLKFDSEGIMQSVSQIGTTGGLDDAGVDVVEGNNYYYITGLIRRDPNTDIGDLFIGYIDKTTGKPYIVRYILSSSDEQGRAIDISVTDTTEVPYVAGYTNNSTWTAGFYDGLLAADSGTIDTCYWRTAVDTFFLTPSINVSLGGWYVYSSSGILVNDATYPSLAINTANSVTCGILTPLRTDERYQDCRLSVELTRNMLTIKAKDGSDIRFQLLTPSGRTLLSREYIGVSHIREYLNLKPGIYILRVNETVHKFVVR